MKEQLLDFDSLLIVLGVLGKKKKTRKATTLPTQRFPPAGPPSPQNSIAPP